MVSKRIATLKSIGVAGAMAVLIGASSASCILSEKCIFVYKTGHKWTATVAGKAVKVGSNNEEIVIGTFSDCKNDADNAVLETGNDNDPVYLALRNELLADAGLDCAQEASDPQEYKQSTVKCDPFETKKYTLTSSIEADGDCTLFSEKELAKGDPEECLPEESSVTTTGTTEGGTVPTSTTPTDGTAGGTTTTGDSTTGCVDMTETDTDTTGGCDMTTAGETGGSTTSPLENFDTMITCNGTTCHVDNELIEAILADTSFLLDDSTRLKQKKKQGQSIGMVFTGVKTGSLADALGFQSGDIITDVQGMPFTNEVEIVAAGLEILDADAVTVTTKRDGKVTERLFIRD